MAGIGAMKEGFTVDIDIVEFLRGLQKVLRVLHHIKALSITLCKMF